MTNFPQKDCNGRTIALDAKGNVSIDCITEDPIVVKGIVDFSHITRMYVGQELAAENARRTQRGLTSIDRPFTQITIKNAQVVMNNPNAKTVNDYYAESKMLFASKKYPEKQFCCTGTNKGNQLPTVFQRDASDPNSVTQIIPDGEPASGLAVTLVFRPFKPKKVGMHTGLSLDSVICDEPFRAAVFGGAASLASLGLNVTAADSAAVEAYNAAGNAATQQPAQHQQPIQTNAATYGQTQYNQPYAQPVPPVPAQMPYNQQAYTQYAQPAPFSQPMQQTQQPAMTTPMPAPAPSPAPAVVPEVPAQNSNVDAYGGISLD